MPYRRLPTTDKARLRALNTALKMAEKKEQSKLAFSKPLHDELLLVKTNFENALKQHLSDSKIQSENNKNYKSALEKARIYLSHFIQIVYMTIEREEMKNDVLKFYGLENFNRKIPVLNSEDEIKEWGKRIIDGDQARIQKGGSAIYSPSIALVKINLETFHDAAIFQHTLKKNTARSLEKMKEIRKSTNEYISRLWSEIEENIKIDSSKHKRQMAGEYGIVYIFRRKEKKKLKPEDLQTDLLFDF